MKKIGLIYTLILCILLPIEAQVSELKRKKITNGEAIFYALPKNELLITITTVHTWSLCGPFYRYATRYLAHDDIITENNDSWRIESIESNCYAVADTSQVYQIKPTKKSITQLISLNEQGVIHALNSPQEEENKPTEIEVERFELPNLKFDKNVLGEEALIANSTAKMAELAAKQIYRIRENRLSLITGDLDFPADGQSLQTILREMDSMEKKLLELFVGKIVEQRHTTKIRFNPEKETDEVLIRFSTTEGLVDSDDLSGDPIYIRVDAAKKNLNLHPKKYIKSGVRYRYPAHTEITIYSNENQINFKRNYLIAQLGDVLILPKKLSQKKMQLIFDEQNGQLVQIKKAEKK